MALAGDVMLGRGVARRLARVAPAELFTPEVRGLVGAADLAVANLECCISERGEPWPDARKPFFFRAPPAAVGALIELGIDCVSLANNHALDFGYDALADTLAYLDDAGIAHVGAGRDAAEARRPVLLEAGGERLAVIGVTDHPSDQAARADRPGVALAEFGQGVPGWLLDELRAAPAPVLVTPHWGPNMIPEPLPAIVRAAGEFVAAGAALVAGHSAHVFHGVRLPVLFDLGDLIDDYAVDPVLRNDLGLLFVATLEGGRVLEVDAYPLHLGYCRTGLARGEERAWIARRFTSACARLGSTVADLGDRLQVAARAAAGTRDDRGAQPARQGGEPWDASSGWSST